MGDWEELLWQNGKAWLEWVCRRVKEISSEICIHFSLDLCLLIPLHFLISLSWIPSEKIYFSCYTSYFKFYIFTWNFTQFYYPTLLLRIVSILSCTLFPKLCHFPLKKMLLLRSLIFLREILFYLSFPPWSIFLQRASPHPLCFVLVPIFHAKVFPHMCSCSLLLALKIYCKLPACE